MKLAIDNSTCNIPLPPCNSTALGTWSAGKEPDALSKLVTDGIFHLQKIVICWWGMHALTPWISHWLTYAE